MDSQLKVLILLVLVTLSKQDVTNLKKYLMDPRNREIAVFEPNFGDCLKETTCGRKYS